MSTLFLGPSSVRSLSRGAYICARDTRWCVFVLLLAAVGVAASGTIDRRLANAVEHHDAKQVRALLAQHVDVNVAQADGTTALHWATYWDDLETTDLLIRAGAL